MTCPLAAPAAMTLRGSLSASLSLASTSSTRGWSSVPLAVSSRATGGVLTVWVVKAEAEAGRNSTPSRELL